MIDEKCAICGAELHSENTFCKFANKYICTSCCCNICGYRRGKEISISVCSFNALNLKTQHGCFLGNTAQIEEAYKELQVLPVDVVVETYEYLRGEYRKGILNAELNSNIRIQLAALQRIIEDMRFSGKVAVMV